MIRNMENVGIFVWDTFKSVLGWFYKKVANLFMRREEILLKNALWIDVRK